MAHCTHRVQRLRLVQVIAACNPYRKRPKRAEDEAVGLVFEHHSSGGQEIGSGIVDPLSDLVYRVHPLPETMMNYVFDFGALSAETEALYITAIINNVIDRSIEDEEKQQKTSTTSAGFTYTWRSGRQEFVDVFAKLVCASQEFIRFVAASHVLTDN